VNGDGSLDWLLGAMEPVLRSGEFVFVTSPTPLALPAMAMVQEAEGITYVLSRDDADERSLTYDFIAAWITLGVQSQLGAVGLTAAVATRLAEADISCNVLAGYFHDHLLVPAARAHEALRLLEDLRDRHRR
jgi:hypothetical protein